MSAASQSGEPKSNLFRPGTPLLYCCKAGSNLLHAHSQSNEAMAPAAGVRKSVVPSVQLLLLADSPAVLVQAYGC